MISPMEELQRVAERKVYECARRGFTLTERDIDILTFIHEYRLLRIEQIEALTGRTYTRVHRRLKGLFDAGFLKRIEMPQRKDIYYPARLARALLLSRGLITEEEAERRSREHELKPATLEHEMMISNIHVTLEIAARSGPLELLHWEEGEGIRDNFDVPETGARVTIQPDAFFRLKDTRLPGGGNTRSFLLEADRSTMPTKPRAGSQRFRDKIERYRLFIEHGRQAERYGVQSIRILTLTLTPARRDNLCADADRYLVENNTARLRKFFLFGALKDVSLAQPSAILGPVLRRPGESAAYPLFPALAETGAGA